VRALRALALEHGFERFDPFLGLERIGVIRSLWNRGHRCLLVDVTVVRKRRAT